LTRDGSPVIATAFSEALIGPVIDVPRAEHDGGFEDESAACRRRVPTTDGSGRTA
jgi:hypothetical protein